ncbi:MAG TPA: hypothetical protein VGA88_03395 [Burkholderiales bacterium]|jgi:hypothetical protein
MADSSQYLCLIVDQAEYLLPSNASVAIEQRDALTAERGLGAVVAWRQTRQGRWPAFGLNAFFQVSRPAHWQRAVFLDGGTDAVGLVADEVRLLGRTDAHVVPFAPLGPPPTRFGHLFNAAWVDGQSVTLVLDPRSLVGYLRSLGGSA